MTKSLLQPLLLGSMLIAGGAFAADAAAPASAAPAAAAAAKAPAEKQAAHEGHEAPAGVKLHLNDGKKWATPPELRQGMANIRAVMAAQLPDIDDGKLKPGDYAVLAGKVESEVGTIISKCKLDKETDEQLHVVLVGMLQGVGKMRGGDNDAERKEGVKGVLRAYRQYGKFFDDPGYDELKR